MLRIVNLNAQDTPACATFEFKGFTVSASTIFGPHNPSVFVFRNRTDQAAVSPELHSVEAAINWINRNGSRILKKEAE